MLSSIRPIYIVYAPLLGIRPIFLAAYIQSFKIKYTSLFNITIVDYIKLSMRLIYLAVYYILIIYVISIIYI